MGDNKIFRNFQSIGYTCFGIPSFFSSSLTPQSALSIYAIICFWGGTFTCSTCLGVCVMPCCVARWRVGLSHLWIGKGGGGTRTADVYSDPIMLMWGFT